jgi:hypothetical protein
MSTAAELRAEADKIDREEFEKEVESRCMSHGIQWSNDGRAFERFGEFVPCSGSYGRPHYDSYSDEYGTRQSCGGCRGSGKNFVVHRLRRPQYDAPRPPKEN